MLTYISVKNFAIIENIEVTFNEGMTSLTGETGAGKSLLIDAIGLLLGDRATSNVVRTGSSKALVEGIFKYKNPKIAKVLKSLDIESENNELIIKRTITPSNNNIIKINGITVTLKELRLVTSLLADIHTQLDTHRLINPLTYLDIIDGFKQEETEKLLQEYNILVSNYRKELKEFNRLKNASSDLLERLDLMKFQVQEIQSYDLVEEEEETLEKEVELMKNFDTIYQVLGQTKTLLENQNSIDTIYDASRELEEIAELNDTYKTIQQRFSSSYYELEDVFETLKDELSSLDFDPHLLDEHQNRLNTLDTLKRKYRKSIPEIMEYYQKIKKDIENIDNYDEVLQDQENNVEKQFLVAFKKGLEISDLRHQTAVFIEKELLDILADLELSRTNFKVEFKNELEPHYLSPNIFTENGIDEVDFLLTTNIGEPLKPLSKSASGGEMSRIMLGFKNLLTKSLGLSLIIFDEIDTGVSGYVAFQVAKKMMEISNTTQVICITHIPQVASLSNHHLQISKESHDGRTYASIKTLSGDSRVHEIAQMISGSTVTNAAIESARELLRQ